MRVAAGMLVVAVLLGEDWNRFRGPNGTGIAAGTGYPVDVGPARNLRWRTPVRPGKSSPVLSRRHIFLTAAQEGKLYTQCFDRVTGKLAWERAVERPRTEIANRLNHEAAITPVTDGENVYVFFKDYGLLSYDAMGKLRWKAPMGPFVNTQGVSASPVIVGDSVVVVVDQWEHSFTAAYQMRDGELKWKVAREEGEGWATPVVHAGRLVTASRGLLGLHDGADGKRLFTLPGLAMAIVSSPALIGDTIYLFGYGVDTAAPFAPRLEKLDRDRDGRLTPQEYGADPILNNIGRNAGNRDGTVTEDEWKIFADKVLGPNALFAVKLDAGGPRELWRYEKNFTSVVPSVLAYQGVLYVVRNGGILTTHDSASGAVVKASRIAGALGGYSSSPVAADGKVWVGSEEGKLVVLKAGAEWEVLAVNDLGEGIYATPALSGGVLHVRTEEALYTFAAAVAAPVATP